MNVRSTVLYLGFAHLATVLYLVGVLEEALEEEVGDVFGAALLELMTAGEGEEGIAGLGDGGEEDAELCELSRPPPVLEGIEVTPGGTGAGAATAAAGRLWAF